MNKKDKVKYKDVLQNVKKLLQIQKKLNQKKKIKI